MEIEIHHGKVEIYLQSMEDSMGEQVGLKASCGSWRNNDLGRMRIPWRESHVGIGFLAGSVVP